jgi:hypothetical protein
MGKLKAKSRELKFQLSALCFPWPPAKTTRYNQVVIPFWLADFGLWMAVFGITMRKSVLNNAECSTGIGRSPGGAEVA